jgi:hypothetical protein
MENIKRTNLSFDQRKPDHERAYKLISEQSLKTEYVIKAILEYEERHLDIINKEFIKDALREVLNDIGIQNIKSIIKMEDVSNEMETIPEEVFEVFDKM